MIEFDITKMSSKGQIVIPINMRKNFNKNEKFLVIKSNDRLILKKAKDLDKNFKEDIIFAKRTQAALMKYEKGKFKKKTEKDFLKELNEW